MYKISKLLLNSLFGKMGMKTYFNQVKVVSSNKIEDLFVDFNIWDVIDLNNGKSIVLYQPKVESEINEDKYHGPNSNVSIAAANTAYGRLHLLPYLVDSSLNISYMDTDCLIVSKELPVSKELGAWKLEKHFEQLWALAPKLYGGVTSDGNSIIKAKGYSGPLDISVLEKLRSKDSFKSLSMNKWFRSISLGSVTQKDIPFTLKVTDFKREAIYDSNNKFVATKPYVIDSNKKVSPSPLPIPNEVK